MYLVKIKLLLKHRIEKQRNCKKKYTKKMPNYKNTSKDFNLSENLFKRVPNSHTTGYSKYKKNFKF